MYSDSTGDTACSLTLAKTSELPAKKGGQTSIPTPHNLYTGGHHTQECSQTHPQIHRGLLATPRGNTFNSNQVELKENFRILQPRPYFPLFVCQRNNWRQKVLKLVQYSLLYFFQVRIALIRIYQHYYIRHYKETKHFSLFVVVCIPL